MEGVCNIKGEKHQYQVLFQHRISENELSPFTYCTPSHQLRSMDNLRCESMHQPCYRSNRLSRLVSLVFDSCVAGRNWNEDYILLERPPVY